MKRIYPFIIYAIVPFLFFCNSSADKKETPLRIAAAANLRFAMEEINIAFEKETGKRVEMVTASSGKLTAQIKNGAPYDVFLSANYKYPGSLYHEGFAENEPSLFCKGTLVIWTNKQIVIDADLITLSSNDNISKIGIANPKNAPFGIAAEELLNNLGIYDSVKSKLVYAENVSQLNQYVINKAVDVGITAKSAIMATKLKGIGVWKEIDTVNYQTVNQYFLKLASKEKRTDIELYLEFLVSDKTKTILNNHGYSTR